MMSDGFSEMLEEEWAIADINTKPNRGQVGGTHYVDMAIQPYEYIHRNGIGFLAGNAIKYLSRYKNKGGVVDLEKAIHSIRLLIEEENANKHFHGTV